MIDQDEPLSDWTLGEVQELCANRTECSGCPFYNMACCEEGVTPDAWSFEVNPQFTDDEIAAMRVFQNALLTRSIIRTENGKLWSGSTETSCIELDGRLFPTILPGQSVRLEDVLEGT